MCTVVTLARPGHDWPLLVAANRDEAAARAWDPPAAHWPEWPGVIGGRDRSGGGTWMAMRDGVVACVLNRPGSLGPQAGKRSRGELPLLALAHGRAADAASWATGLDAGLYRSFNLVIADADRVWFVRGLGHGRPESTAMAPGLHMVTAHDPDDWDSRRVARHLPRFRAAPVPDPAVYDWSAWRTLLDDSAGPREAALRVPVENGFGTVSASVVGVGPTAPPVWLFGRSAAELVPI